MNLAEAVSLFPGKHMRGRDDRFAPDSLLANGTTGQRALSPFTLPSARDTSGFNIISRQSLDRKPGDELSEQLLSFVLVKKNRQVS